MRFHRALFLGALRRARENLLHLKRHAAFGGDEGRGVGLARGHRDLLHLAVESALHGLEQVLVGLGRLLGFLFLLVGFKAEVFAAHVLKRPRGERVGVGRVGHSVIGHGHHAEFVDILGAQQHVVALREHRRHDRQLRHALNGIARGVVNGLLAIGGSLHVFLERNHLLLLGRVEEKQVAQHVFCRAVGGVEAVLHAAAEVLEELLVAFAILVEEILKVGLDFLLDAAGDCLQLAVVLQRLTRDVEREVLRVNDAADEIEVVGQEVFALVHDEHVGAIKRETLLEVLAVQVIRGAARHEQQRVVGQRALSMQRDGARRVGEVVEVRLVELVVLLVGHVRLLALPDGNHRVDRVGLGVGLVLGLVVVAGVFRLRLLARLGNLHLDGVAHVVAVALDQVLQAVLGKIGVVVVLVGVLLEREDDVGAVLGALGLGDGVALNAVGFPRPRLVAAERTGNDAHLGGDHEAGVEADAELADDVDVVTLLLGVVGLERLGIGVCDGAEVLVELVLRHADAVVRDGDGAGTLVEADVNGQLVLGKLHVGIRQALEIEFIDGVGRVRDELAKEDLAIGVDRVDHEVEQFLALCFKFLHGVSLPVLERPLWHFALAVPVFEC